jgi:hypothetical protein
MTRRTFCKLFIIGLVSGIMNELEGDDDDDGG